VCSSDLFGNVVGERSSPAAVTAQPDPAPP